MYFFLYVIEYVFIYVLFISLFRSFVLDLFVIAVCMSFFFM